MSLKDYRKKFPQYDDLPDDLLAKGLYLKYGEAETPEYFAEKIGFSGVIDVEPHLTEEVGFVQQDAPIEEGIKALGEFRKDPASSYTPELVEGAKSTARSVLKFAADIIEPAARGYSESLKFKSNITDKDIDVNPKEPPEPLVDKLKKLYNADILKEKETPERNGIVDSYTADFVRMFPQMATMLGSAAVGGPIAGGMAIAIQIAGGTSEELEKKGVPKEKAVPLGIANAIMQAPLEAIGAGKILSVWKPQKTILQKLKKITAAGFTEWFTELVQSYPDKAVHLIAENPDLNELKKWDRFVSEVWDATKQGAYEGTLTAPWALLGLAGPSKAMREDVKEDQPPETQQREDGLPMSINKRIIAQRAEALQSVPALPTGQGFEYQNLQRDKAKRVANQEYIDSQQAAVETELMQNESAREAMRRDAEKRRKEFVEKDMVKPWGKNERRIARQIKLEYGNDYSIDTEQMKRLVSNRKFFDMEAKRFGIEQYEKPKTPAENLTSAIEAVIDAKLTQRGIPDEKLSEQKPELSESAELPGQQAQQELPEKARLSEQPEKIREEKVAESIRKDEGQVQEAGVERQSREEKSSQDLQIEKPQKAGDEKAAQVESDISEKVKKRIQGFDKRRNELEKEAAEIESELSKKEPWEMTYDEYRKSLRGKPDEFGIHGKFSEKDHKYAHKIIVTGAIQEGKIDSHPDYPELTKKAGKRSVSRETTAPKPTAIGTAWVGNQWKPILSATEIKRGKNKGKFRVALPQKTSAGNQKTKIVDSDAVRLKTTAEQVIKTIKSQSGEAQIINDLASYGADLIKKGHDTFAKFKTEMKRQFAEVWDKIRKYIRRAYGSAKKILKSERGEVTAWHGSPHKFEKFSLDKVGTGEGAQAFGWGLYFTEKKNIARHYANTLSRRNKPDRAYETAKKLDGELRTAFNWAFEDLATYQDVDHADVLTEINNVVSGYDNKYFTDDTVELINKNKDKFKNILESDSNLYRVKLFKGKDPSEYTWLDWDKPVDDGLLRKIKKAGLDVFDPKNDTRISKIDFDRMADLGSKMATKGNLPPAEMAEWKKLRETYKKDRYRLYPGESGEDIYRKLSQIAGGKKEASLFLQRAGIDGIRYPAGSLSGIKDTGAKNYVVFDENAVDIVKDKILNNESGQSELISDLVFVGAEYIRKGADTFTKFRAKMKSEFAPVWDRIKKYIKQAWDAAKKVISNERGEIKIGSGRFKEPYKKIREYLKDNPEATNEDIKKATGIESETIKTFRETEETQGAPDILDKSEKTVEKNTQEHKKELKDSESAFVRTIISYLPKNLQKLTWLEKALKSPEYYTHKVARKIVRVAIERHDLFSENFNDFNNAEDSFSEEPTVIQATQNLKHKGLRWRDIVRGKVSEEYKTLLDMVDDGDTTFEKPKDATIDEALKLFEEKWKALGATDDVINVWKLQRKAYDKALERMIKPMRELLAKKQEQSGFSGEDVSKVDIPEFMNFRDEDGKLNKMSLKEVIKMMESWRGFYAPRLRVGNWVVRATKGAGVNREYIREHRFTKLSANKLANKLKKEGWDITKDDKGNWVTEDTKFRESVMQHIKVADTAKLLEAASNNIKDVDPELRIKFAEDLIQQTADLIRARGFRSTMIHRKTGDVVKGYIEDPLERFTRYISNTAAGLAKNESASKMVKILLGRYNAKGEKEGGIDPEKEHRVYATMQKYIDEQLRNADLSDRVVGMAKSLATFKYLGLPNVRAPFINKTAMLTTVPAAIHEYVGKGKVPFRKILTEILKAEKDYDAFMIKGTSKNLSRDEKIWLEEIKQKGYDDPQYTRDAIGTIQSLHGRAWSKAMQGSMWLFGKTEMSNRGATLLAGYRIAKKAGEASVDSQALAKKAMERAHALYGKATLPEWAQGPHLAAKVGQMLYVYGKFGHNYAQMLYNLGVKKKNIKALMWGLSSNVVLGGAKSFILINFIAGMAKFLMPDERDPEKIFWDGVRENLGDTGERVLRYGAVGALGGDISGSLSFDPAVPKNFLELTGAIGGVINDAIQAKEYITTGNVYRSFEVLLPTGMGNVLKAARESKYGAITKYGNVIWDENGKPYRPSAAETALKVVGFRSARRATVQDRQWEQKKEQYNFSETRNKIYKEYRDYILNPEKEKLKKIYKKIHEYNERVKSLGRQRTIPPITKRSLKAQLRKMKKPTKRERLK